MNSLTCGSRCAKAACAATLIALVGVGLSFGLRRRPSEPILLRYAEFSRLPWPHFTYIAFTGLHEIAGGVRRSPARCALRLVRPRLIRLGARRYDLPLQLCSTDAQRPAHLARKLKLIDYLTRDIYLSIYLSILTRAQ